MSPLLSGLRRIPGEEIRPAIMSLTVGTLLGGSKFVAYYITGSASVFSDAMESLVNVAGAAFALFALAVAHTPADEDHPYGHGKIEFMSAVFEGGLIILASLAIMAKGIYSLWVGPEIERVGIGMAFIMAAMVINGAMGLYLVYVGRKRSSLTLEADGKHLLSDAITSAVAFVALLLVMLSGKKWLDPVGAILVAVYIAYMGWTLVRRANDGLMDRRDAGDQTTIEAVLARHVGPAAVEPKICGFHKLRVQHSGRYHWVDLHVKVPDSLSVRQGHDVATAIEQEISLAFGGHSAKAMVHVEPCDPSRCDHCGRNAAAVQA